MTQENGAETRLRVDRAEKRGLGESQQWERGRRRTEQDGRERETGQKSRLRDRDREVRWQERQTRRWVTSLETGRQWGS